MGQISPLLELEISNGSFRMGNGEASAAEETPSHFHSNGMGQAGLAQLQEAGYCKFVSFDI